MAGSPDPKPVSVPKERKPLRRKATISPRKIAAQRANAAKRVYVRGGRDMHCAVCGEAFYATPHEVARSRRFCSRTCMGIAARKSRKTTCSVCAAEFERPPGRLRNTCSPKCLSEAKRSAKTGTRNPQYRSGTTAGKKRWREGRENACRVCGSVAQLVGHHVVYEQHVRKRGGDIYDTNNQLTVCLGCHSSHHNGADDRIPISKLREPNLVFAVKLLGSYMIDYFPRFYEIDVPLDEILVRYHYTQED